MMSGAKFEGVLLGVESTRCSIEIGENGAIMLE